jgi:hypothetical protein
MSANRAPEDGDVVVRPQWRERTLVYALHIAPSPDQYVCRSRKEAIAQAMTFAKRNHVRAWLSDEDYDFVLLEDFLVETFVRPRMVNSSIGPRHEQRIGPARSPI